MALGNEWEEEKKVAIEKGEDAEKMLQHYIYHHMKKKNLHDVAEIFAQEANLEISHLASFEESLLTKWWESFWPTFCSRLSNEAGANVESSGQLATVNALEMLASLNNQGASSSRQTPMGQQQDVFPVIANNVMSQQFAGNTPMDPQQDVLPVIANNVMSRQFAGNTPIVPNFNNVMQENHVSSLLPPLERNQQAARGLHNCDNVIAQLPAELLSDPGIYQRRTGMLLMNTVSDSIPRQLSANPLLVAEAFWNERPLFVPVELLPGQVLVGADSLYLMPPPGSQSYLQLPALPATMVTPAQFTEGNMVLSCPVGPNSTFAMVADHAGEANWMHQLPPTGLGTAVPGPDLLPYQSRVPDEFLLHFSLAAEAYSRLHPPEQ